jgi:hypothetical protein
MSEPPSFQQSPAPTNWYYCEAAQAYDPYAQRRPGGWLTVGPPAATEPER